MAKHRRPVRRGRSAGVLVGASVLGGVAKAVTQWLLARVTGDAP